MQDRFGEKNTDLGNTQFFKVDVDTASSVEVILETVFEVMKEKGYNPQTQIKLYILTEDKSYITNYNNARQAMLELDREDIIKHLLNYYLEN